MNMSSHPSDQQLAGSLSEGSVEAFRILYERYHQSVYANIFKIIKAPTLAEDILQEVFVALWQNRFRIKTDQSIAGWLFVVSYNKSCSLLKQKVKSSLYYVESYDSYDNVIHEDSIDEEMYATQLGIIEEAVNALSSRKKEVFKLCRFEGKPKEEVALIMGISPESVKDYLKQSNRAIKDYISLKYPHISVCTLLIGMFSDRF